MPVKTPMQHLGEELAKRGGWGIRLQHVYPYQHVNKRIFKLIKRSVSSAPGVECIAKCA
jgi:hypothetical protein